MNHAFVITAYCTNENKCIIDCVKSVRKYHKNSKIIIIDSDSPNKSYFNDVLKYNVEICDIKNKHRFTGSVWYAYENFSKINYFYFLQDSLICTGNVLHLLSNDFNCLRYFPSWDGKGFNGRPGLLDTRCGWADDVPESMGGLGFIYKDPNGLDDRNWLSNQLNTYTKLSIPTEWTSVMGPIFFIKREILFKIKQTGFNKIMPTNKMQACVMERAWGIVLENIGINVYNSSIQKYYLHPEYKKEYLFKKNFYLR
jgi:hypothetical protein